MNKVVWKYTLPLSPPASLNFGRFVQPLPAGAEILCIALQDGLPRLWTLVDPKAPTEPRIFWIVGTGKLVGDGLTYRATWQQKGGMLVWHLFEEERAEAVTLSSPDQPAPTASL